MEILMLYLFVVCLFPALCLIIGIIINKTSGKVREKKARKQEELQFQREKFVQSESLILPRLKELNQSFFFYDNLLNSYSYTRQFRTFSLYEKANFDDILYDYIWDNIKEIKLILKMILSNQNTYKLYLDEFEKIVFNNEKSEVFYSDHPFFKELESELIRREKLYPVIYFNFSIEKTYSSPKGYCVYEDSKIYSISEIEPIIFQIEQTRKEMETAEYQRRRERSLMTDSLRYDVMKRDGFKCCICGASAKEDGIKLHVDHIIPVSKGGTTVMSNLRTLCNHCNMGKSDKYDENGLN